eukprot:gnl/TRDRNA2_/TRDRNA2_152395_c1_seq2.p1 gnl/TRDRNA2_/TRDRNA2_152395_c1~~gnl/TRDRNA2_/TRDRNA2_152395_c1_seq2.p1  ORF type:complete len:129 (-),score=19.84 gnl/TRDRNA2_/TRDRNA2_152395_c1_seq2:464-850(-)
MDPDTGHVEGNLSCPSLELGVRGKPFGVRTLHRSADSKDLLFVAVANNPQDGKNQYFHVVDASAIAASGSCTSVLQSLPIDADKCKTPHLLAVDHLNGDVYLACVAPPKSALLRLRPEAQLPVESFVV